MHAIDLSAFDPEDSLAMTWDEFIQAKAEQLAGCTKRAEFDAIIEGIDGTIERTPPPKGDDWFWSEVYRRYKLAKKPIIKEATAAAALNALLTAADGILRARSGGQR